MSKNAARKSGIELLNPTRKRHYIAPDKAIKILLVGRIKNN